MKINNYKVTPMLAGVSSRDMSQLFSKKRTDIPDWAKQGLWKNGFKQPNLKLQRILHAFSI